MSFINCKVPLILTWSKNFALKSKATGDGITAQGGNPAVAAADNTTGTAFKIKETTLYVPALTLWTNNDHKFLEHLNTRFERTIKGTEYRSDMNKQAKTNNLNYSVDTTTNKVNWLLILSSKINEAENKGNRTLFYEYYKPSV